MTRNLSFWLMKSEPYKYSWDDLKRDGSTYWDGVRNYGARNNLKAMKKEDLSFYYHSNEGKEIVGISKVIKEFYQDPTTDDDRWVVVEIEPIKDMKTPVSLAMVKADAALADMALVKQARLSVQPVTRSEFKRVLSLGNTSLQLEWKANR